MREIADADYGGNLSVAIRVLVSEAIAARQTKNAREEA